jgi:clan AA aspartic protease
MTGTVLNLHALLPVVFQLPGKPELALEFVIDTGFTGELTLPVAAVTALNLPYSHSNEIRIADDSLAKVAIHIASIVWNGARRPVRVLATGRRPLLGTALLDDHELRIRFRENDLVTVDEL